MRPVGEALRKTGLTPDHLTVVGLVIGVGAAFAIGSGRLWLGLILVILAALPDLFDGALAKASNTSSQRGAFFDSTVDRVTDAVLLGGVAWYIAGSESAHMVMLPFAVLAASSLISYQRAKAESLGLDAKGGLMERAERVVLLCIGLLWEPLLVPVLWVMLVLTMHHRRAALREGVAPGGGRPAHRGAHRTAPLAPRRAAGSPARAPAHACSSAARRVLTPTPATAAATRGALDRLSATLTVGGYRTGALLARAMPGPMAAGLAAPIGFGANAGRTGERRAMIERHIRRGSSRQWPEWRLRQAAQQAFDSYARYWIESFRLPTLSAPTVERGIDVRRLLAASPTGWRQGKGVILALPHLGGWEWAGRWLAATRAIGVTVVVERVDPPELFEWFASLRATPRHDRGAARTGGRPGDPAGARPQRDRVPAVRPRHRRRRRRGRVLRRAHHAPRRPGHARPAHRRAARCRSPCTSRPTGRRPPRRGPPADCPVERRASCATTSPGSPRTSPTSSST